MNIIKNDFKESTKRYINEIKNFKSLNKEEELLLFKKLENGDKSAREKLINSNLKFVVAVARTYYNDKLSLQELICEGNIGLVTALDKFDYRRNVKFITYAVWYIRKAIGDFIISRNNIDNVEKCDDEMSSNTNGKYDLYDDDKCDYYQENRVIEMLLSNLNERERFIIENYYGIGCNSKDLLELSKILKISSERVGQIKAKAIKKMRSEVLANSLYETIYK